MQSRLLRAQSLAPLNCSLPTKRSNESLANVNKDNFKSLEALSLQKSDSKNKMVTTPKRRSLMLLFI